MRYDDVFEIQPVDLSNSVFLSLKTLVFVWFSPLNIKV